MSIKHTVQGSEHTAFRPLVSSHNHYTKALIVNETKVCKNNAATTAEIIRAKDVVRGQCDQMVRLFFIFWPFTTMEIYLPESIKNCQSRFKFLQNTKQGFKKLPKT